MTAGAMYGFPYLDPIGALIVSGIIAQIGVSMTAESVYQLLDRLTPKQMKHVVTMRELLINKIGMSMVLFRVL
jgi:divalent metal cation (Fe/Co/Zn/Cd) transporter